jgi:dihydroorotase
MARKTPPEVISSGMDDKNVLLPRTNMGSAMSIYLNLGMTAEQIIERVTSNAARAIKRPELGALNEGGVADIAVLEIQQGKFGFLDSARTRLDANRRFHCVLTVRNGAIVWDSEGLSIPDTIHAGPYTNFK